MKNVVHPSIANRLLSCTANGGNFGSIQKEWHNVH